MKRYDYPGRYTLILISLFFTLTLQSAPPTAAKITNLTKVINKDNYPSNLKEASLEGEVIILIWLNEEGNMMKFKTESYSNEVLRKFVESRLPLLQFEPAKDEFGVRKPSKIKVPFQFKIFPESI